MAIQYKNYLFLATPRTGSNALFYALRSLGGRDIGDHHDIPIAIPDKIQTVACVRNHYDWFVSSWIKATWRSKDPRVRQLTFADWIEEILNSGSEISQFTFPGYVNVATNSKELYQPLWNRCSILLRYEGLESEMRKLLADENFTLPRINTTPHKKDYRKYYSQELQARINQQYSAELQELGYTFENGGEWVPRDDAAPLTGGGLFNPQNIRRKGMKTYADWQNLKNNPK